MPGGNPSDIERIDKAIRTQLDLLRHSADVEGRVLALLEEMRRELVGKLAVGDLTTWGKARLNTLLRDTDTTIATYYTQAQQLVTPSYTLVADISAAQTAAALAASVPSQAVLNALVSDLLIEGSPAKAWWGKVQGDTSFRFAGAVRQGIAQGETMKQIFDRVNSVVDMAGKNSTALVHTSVMQVLNDARMSVQEANANDNSQIQYLATLDSRTCPRCFPRDGLRWYTLSKKPVGHDLEWQQPPLHMACRCITHGVTALADMPGGGRASQFGVVEGRTTFNEFLKRQSPEFVEEVLGAKRAELFTSGKLTLRDLVSGKGAPLTLKQLERIYK